MSHADVPKFSDKQYNFVSLDQSDLPNVNAQNYLVNCIKALEDKISPTTKNYQVEYFSLDLRPMHLHT